MALKFKELYVKAKEAYRETITSMWCSDENSNSSQKAYIKQIEEQMDNMFAPNEAMPLVQCMRKYAPLPENVTREEANALIGGLWKKDYDPYEHQYKCWKALTETTLDGKSKSIVVTTGTGSGKTECFMLPLIADLKRYKEEHPKDNRVKAIFLYPLNALMDDQKKRLNEYLNGSKLKFAVYNSSLPEDYQAYVDFWGQDAIDKNNDEQARYPNIVTTRYAMRRDCDIILTNPTMLEYMLLRNKDQRMFPNKEKDETGPLRWIVIDETHTYSGSAASELAMLMRRVLLAFNVNVDNVRFATSSATMGNGDKNRLKEYISGISGQKIEQIEIIEGNRVKTEDEKHPELNHYRQILDNASSEYVRLDELIEGDDLSIEERLGKLDDLCQKGLEAKAHFFFKAQNQGLRIQLSKKHCQNEEPDGSFEVFTEIPLDKDKHTEPYLELTRCANCGEYIAIGQVDVNEPNKYSAFQTTDSDIFDQNENVKSHSLIFSLSNNENIIDNTGNTAVEVEDDCCLTPIKFKSHEWNIIRNLKGKCPNCGTQIFKQKDTSPDNSGEEEGDLETQELKRFRIPADFISRIIAPALLSTLSESGEKNPHRGQHYLSFVDSRQAAARSTLQQNLEEERLWVNSRIYHELLRRKKKWSEASELIKEKQIRIEERSKSIANGDLDGEDLANGKLQRIQDKLNEINAPKTDYVTFEDIYQLLYASPESEYLASKFVKQYRSTGANNANQGNNEVDANGKATPEAKEEYVRLLLIDHLAKRPKSASSPENMGLFTSFYDLTEVHIEQCVSVNQLNSKLSDDKKITDKDWRDFLHLFMDRKLRTNLAYTYVVNDNKLEEKSRFSTQKQKIRPYKIKEISTKSGIEIRLLASLLGDDFTTIIGNDENKKLLSGVINEAVIQLKSFGFLEESNELNINGEDENVYRLNLHKLSFKLYEHVYLCDTSKDEGRSTVLRPVETIFKGISPFLKNRKVVKPINENCEEWNCYPYIFGKDENNNPVTRDQIEKWAEKNRGLLWNYGIWGEKGCFANRLNQIHAYPEIFVQAEHTAQVEKSVATRGQMNFQDGKINILSCSTTMEMGVDLGDLELVLLSSVPPHPTNYKQRAGRSGRGKDMKASACVTICTTDSIGLRTLKDPMNNIINRETAMPLVDLDSQQVVLRHFNAFLLRESGTITTQGDQGNNLDLKVIDFFTPFMFNREPIPESNPIKYRIDTSIIKDSQVTIQYLPSLLGQKKDSKFGCLLNKISNFEFNKQDAKTLLKNTCFEGNMSLAKSLSIERFSCLYDELLEKITDLSLGYKQYRKKVIENYHCQEAMADNYIREHRGKRYCTGAMLLHYKYGEILSENLIGYLSTNRCTPNANMPVNIIEFDVNFNNIRRNYYNNNRSNPSYVMQEAIAQYAPGNKIVLSNQTYIVRGLLYTGSFRENYTFKRIISKDGIVRISNNEEEWNGADVNNVNKRTTLELVQPYAFIPDANELPTRVMDKSPYTYVDAKLIDADKGHSPDENLHLVYVRTNTNSGNSKILFFISGKGYGYCICTNCGKTVVEENPSSSFPSEMNVVSNPNKEEGASKYICKHDNVRIKRGSSERKNPQCNCSDRKLRRHVIIGDMIQTDYCEIMIRNNTGAGWIESKNISNEKNLVLTLAIVLSRTLTEYLGIDERDIAFTITQNNHICIYDTNPGGSGYSKRLGDMVIFNEVIDRAITMLEKLEHKDELLEKSTLRYLEDLEVEQTLEWLKNESECRKTVPEKILTVYPNAKQTYFSNILETCKLSKESPILFADSDWNKWIYQSGDSNEECWNSRIIPLKISMCMPKLCVYGKDHNNLPLPLFNSIDSMKDWMVPEKCCVHVENPLNQSTVYPLAYADGKLFFTSNTDNCHLDGNWGKSNIFYCKMDKIDLSGADVYKRPKNNCSKFTMELDSNHKIEKKTSKEIAPLVYEYCNDIVNRFTTFVNNSKSNEPIEIVYEDGYVMSAASMVVSLQFIKYFIDMMPNKEVSVVFKVEDYKDAYGSMNWMYNTNQRKWEEEHQKVPDITYNLRKEWRDKYFEKFKLQFIESNNHIKSVKLETLTSRDRLPHYRSLSFSYGRSCLKLYPNGGIINEWKLDRNHECPELSQLKISDSLNLFRKQPIMYDALIEGN